MAKSQVCGTCAYYIQCGKPDRIIPCLAYLKGSCQVDEEEDITIRVSNIRKQYEQIQQILRDYEDMTGVCQDGISDCYYDRYEKKISKLENAVNNNEEITDDLTSLEDSLCSSLDNVKKKYDEMDDYFLRSYVRKEI